MRILARISVASALLLAACTTVSSARDDLNGGWPAASSTAISITGDIIVTDTALQFEDGQRLAWVFEETRKGGWGPSGQQIDGAIYRVADPSDPTLIRGNTLCGWPVTYIVLSPDAEDALIMNVFRGDAIPSNTEDGFCAMYYYAR